MANQVPSFGKRVYVPSWSRAQPATTSTQTALPAELCFERASGAFRSVAWDGTGRQVEVALPPSKPLEPTLTARAAFAQIPWAGETRAAPTDAQSARSVVRVLGTFKWE